MLEPISQLLAKLDLKKAEGEIYFVCLENKEGLFVSQIAQLTGIQRSSVNLILTRLADRGFITFHLEGQRKRFVAEAPEKLVFQLEESVNDLKQIIPFLNQLTGEKTKSSVRFFEGKENVEKIFDDILLTMKMSLGSEEILAISSSEDITVFLPQHQKKFIDKRVKERIPLRWLAPDSQAARIFDKTSENAFRKMKLFDSKKFPFRIEIDVYGNKIALINLRKQPSGVIIQDADLAASVRSVFNMLWTLL